VAKFKSPSVSTRKFSMRHIRSRKSFDARNKKKVRKPALKPGISKQSKSGESGEKLNNQKADTIKGSESKPVYVEHESVFDEVFSFGNSAECIAETVIESTVIFFNIMMDFVLNAPMYEEYFRIIASLCLIFYGGSWTNLAGSIAAIEAFGTIPALQEVFEVGVAFLFDDSDDVVTPERIKENLRQLGLQTTLLIAVLVSPSWAEICITIAFASKFTILVPVQELLKKVMSRPDVDVNEFDCFDNIDTSWFDLIAVIACNILSLIFFGCLPRLTTAMYMGYLGVALLMEGLVARPINIPIIWDSELFDKDFWMKTSTQYSVWAIVAVTAIWQAVSGYEGVFLLLSWSMFLYPVVTCLSTNSSLI